MPLCIYFVTLGRNSSDTELLPNFDSEFPYSSCPSEWLFPYLFSFGIPNAERAREQVAFYRDTFCYMSSPSTSSLVLPSHHGTFKLIHISPTSPTPLALSLGPTVPMYEDVCESDINPFLISATHQF